MDPRTSRRWPGAARAAGTWCATAAIAAAITAAEARAESPTGVGGASGASSGSASSSGASSAALPAPQASNGGLPPLVVLPAASAGAGTSADTDTSTSTRTSAGAGAPTPASGEPRGAKKPRRFYRGYDYGSEAVYNPAYVLVNRGWDMMQLGDDRNDPWHFQYGKNAENVFDNVIHAPSRISEEGWWRFAERELLPLSWRQDTARWVPNYTLHLLGGGQTFAMLDEWFDAHEVPLPWAWSALTLMSAAFINESIENGGVVGRNTDCLADLLVFDLGGILFFSAPAVREFFSRYVRIMDWSTPPVLTYPKGELHNQGNYYAARWAVPFWKPLGLFSYFGGAWTTFGLSYTFDGERSITATYGVGSTKLIGTARNYVENAVTFVPGAGIFYDRNGSLLASLKVANLPDYFLHLQAYPGLVPKLKWLGGFLQVSKNGNFIAGLTTTLGFGLGVRTGDMH